MMVLRHRVRGGNQEFADRTARAVLGSLALPTLGLPFPFLTEMLGRKCGPDKNKRMQPPSVPEKPKKAVKEPVPEAKGYEEIRARIKK